MTLCKSCDLTLIWLDPKYHEQHLIGKLLLFLDEFCIFSNTQVAGCYSDGCYGNVALHRLYLQWNVIEFEFVDQNSPEPQLFEVEEPWHTTFSAPKARWLLCASCAGFRYGIVDDMFHPGEDFDEDLRRQKAVHRHVLLHDLSREFFLQHYPHQPESLFPQSKGAWINPRDDLYSLKKCHLIPAF